MTEAAMIGCGACNALPRDQWCEYHERTLRRRVTRPSFICPECGQTSCTDTCEEHRKWSARHHARTYGYPIPDWAES